MKIFAILFLVVLVAAHAQAAPGIDNALLEKALTTALQSQNQGGLSWIQRALTAAARTRCRWTEKMSQEEEDQIRANFFTDLSHKQQCFIKCVSDTFTFVDAAVALLAIDTAALNDVLGPLVDGENELAVAAACGKLEGADECETAALNYKCYNDFGAIHYI